MQNTPDYRRSTSKILKESFSPVWRARVEQARAVDMVRLAERYGAKLTKDSRSGVELVGPCPVCGGTDRFAIKPRDKIFNCRRCVRGGRGPIDLLMFLSGISFAEAVRQLTGGLSGELRQQSSDDIIRERARQQAAANYEAEQHDMARKLWHMASPPAGTVVETYLHVRGYYGVIPPTIKFLNSDKYGPTMVAAFALPGQGNFLYTNKKDVQEVTGNFVYPTKKEIHEVSPHNVRSVHLTSLRDDGSDRLRHKGAKRVVGTHVGLPITVSPIGVDGLLHICEGVESASLFASEGGAWAAGSAVHMPALAASIPEHVVRLIIEQHEDDAGRNNTRRLIEEIRELERTGVRPGHPMKIEIVGERP